MEMSDFNYTDELQCVIDASYDESERLGGKIVTVDCLMLGILKVEKSIAYDLLQKMDFNISFFKKLIESEQKDIFEKLTHFKSKSRVITMNKNAKEVLKNTVIEAIKFKAETINSFHLLCALLKYKNSIAAQALEKLSITPNEIETIHFSTKPSKMDNVIEKFFVEFEERKHNTSPNAEIPTGFPKLDEKIRGWKPSQLVVVGGRPCIGKTTFVNQLARNATLEYRISTAIFSLDLSKESLVYHFITMETEIYRGKIIGLDFDKEECDHIQNKVSALYNLPIFIDDTQKLGIREFKFKAKELVKSKGVRLIVLDGLQLMKTNKNMMKELKAIAIELNVVIIATTQLSRSVEKRGGDMRPLIIDLEKPADKLEYIDTLILIYRPEYYGIEVDEFGESLEGITELIIKKNNNNWTWIHRLNYINQFQMFLDNI